MNAKAADAAQRPTPDPDAGGERAAATERPAWAVSLTLHLGVLLALASLSHVSFSSPVPAPLDSRYNLLTPDDLRFDTAMVEQFGNNSPLNKPSPSQAAATSVSATPQKEMQQQLEEDLLAVDTPPTAEIPLPPENEFTDVVDVQGQTEHPGGVEGAIDRMAVEIDRSLQEHKTLVCWLFDESGSMTARRNAIADRFELIHRQLGVLKEQDTERTRRPLKTAIVGFSDATRFYTPKPVDDITAVVPVIRKIPTAKTDFENVFTAVRQVITKWQTYRRTGYRMMLVIVTDERGTDYGAQGEKLEQVIALARKFGVKIYCIGNAAVFGREKGYILYRYPDGYTQEWDVDQGPESVMMERLALPFWGTGGFGRRQMSSGYGPYALNRLCAESKGIYLIADEGRGLKFDPALMRAYQPDYRPIRVYVKALETNLAKQSLIKAAAVSRERKVPSLSLRFDADNDNVLRRELDQAQRPAAEYEARLRELQAYLAAGEKDRPRLDEPRWQAGYDLAMGRVLALLVRTFGYNAMLAQMKGQPKRFSKQGNNEWRLKPGREITTGGSVKKMHKQALVYLNQVVDQHAGTPWAALAERELSIPLGWTWVESSRPATSAGNRNAANKPRVLFVIDPKTGKKRKVMKNKPRPRPPL